MAYELSYRERVKTSRLIVRSGGALGVHWRTSMVLVLTLVLTASASIAESHEQDLLCQINTCDRDPLIEVVKRQEVGRIKFYAISPKGRMASGVKLRGSLRLVMYNRPINNVGENPQYLDYDEVWVTKVYADMDFNNRRSRADELADESYDYWKTGNFVVTLVYSAADLMYVPMTLLRGDKPSPQEEFTYKKIDGEWFVLDSLWDRVWFDAAVEELN